MKRILFFVHFNKYDGLSKHVLYLLEHIKHIYSRIIIISNSKLNEQQAATLAGLSHSVIERKNTGFDFGAWKETLLQEGWENLEHYDSVTLMNDTCFGPVFDMEQTYKAMEERQYDFWGMTVHPTTRHGMPGNNWAIPEHLQSYFLCFNKKVVASKTFQKFWHKVKNMRKVNYVIQKYETKLTQNLAAAGFSYSAVFDSRNSVHGRKSLDMANLSPDFCIENHVPLIKIKAFVQFPHAQYVLSLIKTRTQYPAQLIHDFFFNNYNPTETLLLDSKSVSVHANNQLPASKPHIAIHLHVYWFDVFTEYVEYFNNIELDYDLYITTDTEEKQQSIKKHLASHLSHKKASSTIVVDRITDILPWLAIDELINSYDIVGHFNTKKILFTKRGDDIFWQQEVFDVLLKPINTIINSFLDNENIGIIIPEIPYNFRFVIPWYYILRKDIHILQAKLWKQMNCKKTIDFRSLSTAITPLETMFWYRPKALKPLFQLHLSKADLQPWRFRGRRLLYTIECLLVYIAWNEGYDYRVMASEMPTLSSFADNMTLNKEINRLKKSLTYRLGQSVLALPKAIRDILEQKNDEP